MSHVVVAFPVFWAYQASFHMSSTKGFVAMMHIAMISFIRLFSVGPYADINTEMAIDGRVDLSSLMGSRSLVFAFPL